MRLRTGLAFGLVLVACGSAGDVDAQSITEFPVDDRG